MAYDGHDLHELVMLQVCDYIGLHDSLDVVSWIPLASLPSSGAALLVMPMPASSMVMVELACLK